MTTRKKMRKRKTMRKRRGKRKKKMKMKMKMKNILKILLRRKKQTTPLPTNSNRHSKRSLRLKAPAIHYYLRPAPIPPPPPPPPPPSQPSTSLVNVSLGIRTSIDSDLVMSHSILSGSEGEEGEEGDQDGEEGDETEEEGDGTREGGDKTGEERKEVEEERKEAEEKRKEVEKQPEEEKEKRKGRGEEDKGKSEIGKKEESKHQEGGRGDNHNEIETEEVIKENLEINNQRSGTETQGVNEVDEDGSIGGHKNEAAYLKRAKTDVDQSDFDSDHDIFVSALERLLQGRLMSSGQAARGGVGEAEGEGFSSRRIEIPLASFSARSPLEKCLLTGPPLKVSERLLSPLRNLGLWRSGERERRDLVDSEDVSMEGDEGGREENESLGMRSANNQIRGGAESSFSSIANTGHAIQREGDGSSPYQAIDGSGSGGGGGSGDDD
mmetsp:Transcript_27777/g.51326  ORF Transcript_27777/g.51326 Transcript_27777/m.51326 type:complete len:438 (-) Transcript_27777:1006-2319(-)